MLGTIPLQLFEDVGYASRGSGSDIPSHSSQSSGDEEVRNPEFRSLF
jgi:hypothetical protein